MRLVVTTLNVGLWAALYLKSTLRQVAPTVERPFVLGLPTGETVLEMYAMLRTLAKQRALDYQHLITFNMDEYVGIPADHPQSYHAYMRRNLFDYVPIPRSHIFIPNGQAADLPAECARYEHEIARAHGMNLLIGGIGRNGHIAFNEPGTPFHTRTHVVELTPSTLEANARFFGGDESRVPRRAITMGIGTILDAKELLFLASGVQKAAAVEHLLTQKPTLDWPITAIHLHPHATLVADTDACILLSGELKTRLDEARAQNPHADEWILEIE